VGRGGAERSGEPHPLGGTPGLPPPPLRGAVPRPSQCRDSELRLLSALLFSSLFEAGKGRTPLKGGWGTVGGQHMWWAALQGAGRALPTPR